MGGRAGRLHVAAIVEEPSHFPCPVAACWPSRCEKKRRDENLHSIKKSRSIASKRSQKMSKDWVLGDALVIVRI
jgi:hypothetical protein